MPRHSMALLFPPVLSTFVACLCGTVCLSLHAQMAPPPSNGQRTNHPVLPGMETEPFPDNPEMRHKLEKSRAADRQRRIVDDANRLVSLTVQYRKSVDSHGAPNEDDQKLLVQIEKLARDVKDRMRGM